MPQVTVGKENSGPIELYYEDHGSGDPVVLIHGWPLSGASWERQVTPLLEAGHRVIAYDRRGFGRSSKPSSGYDYDTLSTDFDKLMTTLNLRDVTLVGFSMGGGEIARYLGAYGADRVKGAVFISAITPYFAKAHDNPEGADPSLFDGIQTALRADRPAFLTKFLAAFYNADVLKGKLVSDDAMRMSWTVAIEASAKATVDCVSAWGTDFRADLKQIEVPTLVIHGDADKIVPFPIAGKRMPQFVKNAKLVVIEGGPHAILWTHAEQVNRALADFLAGLQSTKAMKAAR